MQIELNRFDAEEIIKSLKIRIAWGKNEIERRNEISALEIKNAIYVWQDIIDNIVNQAKSQSFVLDGSFGLERIK